MGVKAVQRLAEAKMIFAARVGVLWLVETEESFAVRRVLVNACVDHGNEDFELKSTTWNCKTSRKGKRILYNLIILLYSTEYRGDTMEICRWKA